MLQYIIAGSLSQRTEAIGRFFALLLLVWSIIPSSQAQIRYTPRRYVPPTDIWSPIEVTRPGLSELLHPNIGGGGDDDEPPDLIEQLNSLTLEGFLQAEEESGDSVTLERVSPLDQSNVYGWIHHPPKITLGVRVVSKGEEQIILGERDKVNIEAHVYHNRRIIRRLKLLDNGQSGDSERGDGIYSAVFVPPTVGTYRFQTKAKLTIYRQGRVYRKNLRAKEVSFYVVAVPYAQIERPIHESVLREDLQVTAKIFRLKKLYEEPGAPLNATLIVRGEEYEKEVPMHRIGSTLTAAAKIPKNGIYDISIKINYNTRWSLFTVSTEPIRVRVEKPVPLLTIALYTLSLFTVLIVALWAYSMNYKTNNM